MCRGGEHWALSVPQVESYPIFTDPITEDSSFGLLRGGKPESKGKMFAHYCADSSFSP